MNIVPKCSFRIIGLSENELSDLIDKYLDDVKYRKGTNHKDKEKKVLRIIIDESINSDLLNNLLGGLPDEIYYDFFISVSSNQETAVVDVPELVLKLHKEVGGKICFSYTYVE